MIIKEAVHLAHIGTPRHSGRYPWGSGGNSQRSKSFLDYIADLKKQGLTEAEIYKGLDMTSTEFRIRRSIARNEQKQADIAMAVRLHQKGYSNDAIGTRMNNRNESSIRSLLAASKKDVVDRLHSVANILKKLVDEKGYIDVGSGVENHLDVKQTMLSTALLVH